MRYSEEDELNNYLDDMGIPTLTEEEQENIQNGVIENEKSDD